MGPDVFIEVAQKQSQVYFRQGLNGRGGRWQAKLPALKLPLRSSLINNLGHVMVWIIHINKISFELSLVISWAYLCNFVGNAMEVICHAGMFLSTSQSSLQSGNVWVSIIQELTYLAF